MSRWLAGLAASLVLVAGVVLAGCSHETPFVREAPDAPTGVLLERLILLGDAGSVGEGDPLLDTLAEWSGRAPHRTTVVYLGDNVYPRGLHAGASRRKQAIVERQVDAGGRAQVLFVPGNHDWEGDGREGLAFQRRFVEERGASLLPEPGCPGPAADPGTRHFLVVALDTQWFLERDPPLCGARDRDDALRTARTRIGELLEAAGDRPVLVAAHHPLATHGSHGGFLDWRDYLFPLTRLQEWLYLPLPLLYPAFRAACPSAQDLCHRDYEAMSRFLHDAFAVHGGAGPLVFASGHEHGLQILRGREPFDTFVVSGAGSKLSSVGDAEDTLYAHLERGFVVLDAIEDAIEGQGVALRVVEPEAGEIFPTRLGGRGAGS